MDGFTIDSQQNIYHVTNLDHTVIFYDSKTENSKLVARGLKKHALLGVGALGIGRERRNYVTRCNILRTGTSGK